MPPQPQRPALNNGASPNQASPEPQPAPSRSGHLRTLVQTLIAFANTLVETLSAHTHPTAHAAIALRFGTTNLTLITARIARAVLMAMALNRRLARVARRLDNPLARPPTSAARIKPTQPRVPRTPALDPAADDAALLARLPTAQDIAAQIRNRPIGRVLEDICRDLGILPSDPLWRELQLPIIVNGGNLVRLFKRVTTRVIRHGLNPPPAHQPRGALAPALPNAAPPIPPFLAATGPP